MQSILAISAYQTSAEAFFTTIREARADLVLDVRLHNESQLAGFSKQRDLAWLVPALCQADYVCDRFFAPEPGLLSRYIKRELSWDTYAGAYRNQMQAADVSGYFIQHYGQYRRVCLIGTATKKRRSHSEVLQELLTPLLDEQQAAH
ncbi:DUF488 domain-containing protein [Oscillospiraceae bacterium HV4-5-C5C]|nr:DUF488 domain-containing protein [Oscillospiraceae bacterium HV4-5-C5C]